jgi:hypothetical protein
VSQHFDRAWLVSFLPNSYSLDVETERKRRVNEFDLERESVDAEFSKQASRKPAVHGFQSALRIGESAGQVGTNRCGR